MKNDVGPIKIHQVVSKISQVTFSPLVTLFLFSKNKNADYFLISLGIGEKKYVWGGDFKYEVKFLEKPQESTQKLAQKFSGCSTLPPHIQNLQKQIFLQPMPKC